MAEHLIAFWNIENLFAPENFPGREPWIARRMADDLKGWSDALFQRKMSQLAGIIVQMKGGMGPDLLGVCEVENRFCLDALAAALNQRLPARRYDVVHADSTKDQRGIDTAFIYDAKTLTPDPATIFSHFVMRRTGTRDITQVTFTTTAGNEFVALCNHWPSRSGGHHTESQGYRMTAGETLSYWHERIREVRGESIPVIALGDLNDDPGDPSVSIHAQASRERDDIENAKSARFYNLSWDILRQDVMTNAARKRTLYGTLYFQGNANLFDQILVSRALLLKTAPLRIKDGSMRIEAYPEMVSNSKNDGPIRFGLPKGDAARNINEDGFSDHFPVSFVLLEAAVA
jgi:predicted extracellular nuclease